MARKTVDTPAKARKGSKTTLTEANLVDLGAERLATILMDLSTDSHVKRALRLELFAEASPEGLAGEITKRLTAIAKATSRIHWRKRAAFAKDLELHLRMIVRLAEDDAPASLGLLLDFLDMAAGVFDRVSQPEGPIGEAFEAARDAVSDIAGKALVSPPHFADRIARLILTDEHFMFGSLVADVADLLGVAGRARLAERLEAALASRPARAAAYDARVAVIRDAQRRLADHSGDVDAFAATFTQQQRRYPLVAAEIAKRLLGASRPVEALEALTLAAPVERSRGSLAAYAEAEDPADRAAWEDVRLEVLEANGRKDEAQATRWKAFETTLSIPKLRLFLKALPDFDDVEAEDEAKALASAFPRFDAALGFFIEWPDPAGASRLVLKRREEIDGVEEDLLTAAARRLEGSHPLAATILLRSMIRYVLTYGVATRYKAAAKQLLEAESLAPQIRDYGDLPDHAQFLEDLRSTHGRKQGFWNELTDLGG